MQSEARILWHESFEKSLIKSVKINADEVFVHSKYSMVSLGTERLVALGRVSTDLHEEMKVPYMLGSLSLPCSYGYSTVGIIEDTNKVVHILHPHQDVCPVRQSSVFELPSILPRYTLISNMETAINIFWDAQAGLDDEILILGAGTVGLLTASVFAKEGYTVKTYDSNPLRMEKALNLGFEQGSLQGSYPVLINTTGSASALNMAISLTSKNGVIVEASWYGTGEVGVNLDGEFHYNRLTIKSSQVGSIPPHKAKEWDFKKRKQFCFEYLKDPFYDHFIDKVIRFEDLPLEFDRIRKNEIDYLSLVVKY